MARGERRRKRLSPEEGRRLLLDEGRALVYEQPAPWPLEHVRLTEVAQRAGVTAGALYHYWDTQEDYRDDLLDDLFSPDRFAPSATVPEMAAAISEDPQPIEEFVRHGAEVEFEALRSSPDLRVLMAMWAADDAEINPRIAAQFRAVGDHWAGIYEAVFRSCGLEIRPPFTYPMMAALFTAVGDGLAVRSSVDPESVPVDLIQPTEDGPVPWGLLGCALLALLPALSRPAGSDSDFWDLVEALQVRPSGEDEPA